MTDYIADMDTSAPGGGRQRKNFWQHMRTWKQALYDTLKNWSGEVSASHTEVNYLDGVLHPLPFTMGTVHATDTYSSGKYELTGYGSGETYITSAPDQLVVKFHATNSGHTANGTYLRLWSSISNSNDYELFRHDGTELIQKELRTGVAYQLVRNGTASSFRVIGT